jgi:hypothetical protein
MASIAFADNFHSLELVPDAFIRLCQQYLYTTFFEPLYDFLESLETRGRR